MYRLGNGADDIRDAKNVRVLFFALKKIIRKLFTLLLSLSRSLSYLLCILLCLIVGKVVGSVNYISYVTDNSLECCPY